MNFHGSWTPLESRHGSPAFRNPKHGKDKLDDA
jgi:hypothetical protein